MAHSPTTRAHNLELLCEGFGANGESFGFAGWNIAMTFLRSLLDKFGYAVCLCTKVAISVSERVLWKMVELVAR